MVRNAVDLKIVPDIENSVNGSEKFFYRLKNKNIVDCQKKFGQCTNIFYDVIFTDQMNGSMLYKYLYKHC